MIGDETEFASDRAERLAELGLSLRAAFDAREAIGIVVRDARASLGALGSGCFRVALVDGERVPTLLQSAGSVEAFNHAAVAAAILAGGSIAEETMTLAPFALDADETGMLAVDFGEREADETDRAYVAAAALALEFTLANLRLNVGQADRRRRAESLNRTLTALRDANELHDVLAFVVRALANDFERPCAAYEYRGGVFRPVVASEIAGERRSITTRELDPDQVRAHGILRHDTTDIAAVLSDGKLDAILVLERAAAPLGIDDLNHLRTIAALAGIALGHGRTFDQLRRYAAEGAALTEASRTILKFAEREPLADALCKIVVQMVNATSAFVYSREGGQVLLLGRAVAPGGSRSALFSDRSSIPTIVAPLIDHRAAKPDEDTYLLVTRAREFERRETRLVETLASLAQLALRNVDLYEQTSHLNAALGESNAFKDDLMAMFAHDFRGPLTVISGFSELLLETESGEARSNAQTIFEQAKRLAKLAEDALALAATQTAGFSLQREREDLAAFVREAVKPLDGGSGRITVELPAEPIVVSFDRQRLRHAIDNVIGNALKYSEGPVAVRLMRDLRWASIEVADHGIGIPPDEIDRIFTRFGRASNVRGKGISGSGVGLYIARKIVEVHGGELVVRSVENEGSTFSIRLPVA
jgi:signal transduction histidine kinase